MACRGRAQPGACLASSALSPYPYITIHSSTPRRPACVLQLRSALALCPDMKTHSRRLGNPCSLVCSIVIFVFGACPQPWSDGAGSRWLCLCNYLRLAFALPGLHLPSSVPSMVAPFYFCVSPGSESWLPSSFWDFVMLYCCVHLPSPRRPSSPVLDAALAAVRRSGGGRRGQAMP